MKKQNSRTETPWTEVERRAIAVCLDAAAGHLSALEEDLAAVEDLVLSGGGTFTIALNATIDTLKEEIESVRDALTIASKVFDRGKKVTHGQE